MTNPDASQSVPKKACCTPSKASGDAPPPPTDAANTVSLPAQQLNQPGQPDSSVGIKPPIREARTGSTADMVQLDGGTFLMGTDDEEGFPDDGEGPIREITVKPFWIDRGQVTNAQFSEFIKATGYKTEAERFGWSFVFHFQLPKSFVEKNNKVQGLQWWIAVPEARWDRPEGRRSNIRDRMDHPAVHVSWSDAQAYCEWAGKRLATEAEWEYAARGGLEQKKYAWGDHLTPRGKHMCNIWQGKFPEQDAAEDGYAGTCPVTAFNPNGFGLHCVAGNVWEWTADWWDPFFHQTDRTTDPLGPNNGTAKLMRGGSFLCHHSYCNRYRVAARTANTPDSSTSNCGFRCVRDV